MKHRLRSAAGAIVVLAMPLTAGSAQTQPSGGLDAPPRMYTITEIAMPPGDVGIQPRAINDRGEVVGYVESVRLEPRNRFGGVTVVTRAFLWRSGTMTAPFAPSKSKGSDVLAINNKGDILGRLLSVRASGGDRCVLLRGGREYELVPPYRSLLRPHRSLLIEPSALDDTGLVVGDAEAPAGPLDSRYRACLWRSPGKRPLILRGGTGAFGIDGSGRIGLAQSKTVDNEAYTCEVSLYDHGRVTRIGPRSGFPRVVALAMNRSGDVLLEASTSDWYQANFEKAFLWSKGVLMALPLLADRMGTEGAQVARMNDSLVVVGTASRLVSPPPHGVARLSYYAICFDCRTGLYADLNSLVPASSGWTLEQATGINDRGQIIGVGQHRGKKGAFLLTPYGVK